MTFDDFVDDHCPSGTRVEAYEGSIDDQPMFVVEEGYLRPSAFLSRRWACAEVAETTVCVDGTVKALLKP